LLGYKDLQLTFGAWLPDGEPKAVAIVVHGYGEHMGRYVHVIETLVRDDYAVYSIDHRGHGSSAGLRADVERFDHFVDDLHLLVRQAEQTHPYLPRFMIGHSMGGLIAARYALRYQAGLTGLVLSGPALWIGDDISLLLKRLSGILSLIVPTWPITKVTKGPESVLSRDPLVQEQFDADPHTYKGKLRARMGNEMMRAATDARARMSGLSLPLLIMHGAEDKLTNPNGSRLLYEQAGSRDKTLQLWPGCRHEIFNEPERDQVIDFMIGWLDQHVSQEAAVAANAVLN
jgi:alpha-beta hydrolase superfamily lysophospholipase